MQDISLKQMMINKFNTILYDTRGDECYGNGYNFAKPHPYLIRMIDASLHPEPMFRMKFIYYGPSENGGLYRLMTAEELKRRFPGQVETYMDNIETQEEFDAIQRIFK